MTVPNNLFIDTPEIEDVSMTSLSSDSSVWPEEIITKLKERIPSVAALSASVKFMHLDEENGTATGSVTVTDGKKTIVVPVIAKEFSMYPLDTFTWEGKMLPLTPDFFSQVFMDGSESAFGQLLEYPLLSMVDRYLRGENLQNVVFPPNWGRYAFASANVPEGILDDIKASIDGKEIKKLAEADQNSVARFFSNDMYPLINSLSHLQPVNMNEFRQSIEKLVHRNVHVISKDGPNRYTLLSTQLDTFNPAIDAMTRGECEDFCSRACSKPDSMHEVDQNGEKVITVVDDSGSQVFLFRPQQDKPEHATVFGRYNVRTKTGLNVEGVVVPVVIDFDQNAVPTKLFLGKGLSTIQESIVGSRIVGEGNWMPEGQAPTVGQTGTFLYHEGEKGAVATLPVTIKAVWHEAGNDKFCLKVVDLNGLCIRLDVLPDRKHGGMGLERITRLGIPEQGQPPHYLIPGSMKWVPMEGFDAVSSSEFDYLSKTAAHKITGNPVKMIHTGYDQYSIRGLDKYAGAMGWDKSCLSSTQTKFLLAAMGMGETKIAEAITEAKASGMAEIHGLNYPPLQSEKIASFIPRAQEMQKTASAFKNNFFKVASYIENAQTVDALLSLNFVNAENISKFIAKIPLFKAAISHLASCLLASRLGIREIPEQSASGAMSKLIDVVNGLEALRATQVVAKKK
jgi:hypothetical protein